MEKNNIEVSYSELKINLERIKAEITDVVNQMQAIKIARINSADNTIINSKANLLAFKYNELLRQYLELETVENRKNSNIEQSLISRARSMEFCRKH